MKKLLQRLNKDYPDITFIEGDHFYWSPKGSVVTYSLAREHESHEITLLHELAHALLCHKSFTTDFELLRMEVDAWDKAQELGTSYSVTIPEEHIDRCLDTYRDWLHLRSTCPSCKSNGLQSKQTRSYHCFTCDTYWEVSKSRLCRPYRQKVKL